MQSDDDATRDIEASFKACEQSVLELQKLTQWFQNPRSERENIGKAAHVFFILGHCRTLRSIPTDPVQIGETPDLLSVLARLFKSQLIVFEKDISNELLVEYLEWLTGDHAKAVAWGRSWKQLSRQS